MKVAAALSGRPARLPARVAGESSYLHEGVHTGGGGHASKAAREMPRRAAPPQSAAGPPPSARQNAPPADRPRINEPLLLHTRRRAPCGGLARPLARSTGRAGLSAGSGRYDTPDIQAAHFFRADLTATPATVA
eukprot:350556-Chlamydomonas_euryale.AAC.2